MYYDKDKSVIFCLQNSPLHVGQIRLEFGQRRLRAWNALHNLRSRNSVKVRARLQSGQKNNLRLGLNLLKPFRISHIFVELWAGGKRFGGSLHAVEGGQPSLWRVGKVGEDGARS